MNVLFYGIVEDREDPLKLGRVRARISGVHTDNLAELPTRDLPWATPIQSYTSAAVSGIGTSATGPVEGTLVVIIFADDTKQVPLVIGTIAGVPSKDDGAAAEEFDSIRDELRFIPPDEPPPDLVEIPGEPEPKPVTEVKEIPPNARVYEQGYIGTLTKSQVEKLKQVIGQKESGNVYTKENTLGFLGKYQFGAPFLEDTKYIISGAYKRVQNNLKVVNDTINWLGKDGVSSKQSLLNNPTVQESLMDTMLKRNFTSLCKGGALSPSSPPEKVAGALMCAHLKGSGGARKYIVNGIDSSDAYGTSTSKYYKIGYETIAGKSTVEAPTAENINSEAVDKNTSNSSAGAGTSNLVYDVNPNQKGQSKQGFTDPNSKYPLPDHINEPDTPRLASVMKISETIVGQKETEKETGIPVANGSTTWDQSPVPYNARYPFNHAMQTESGHVMEFDDTEGSERINIHHMSGTFKEIDNEGNTVERVKGIRTVIVEKDELVYIMGSGHVSIQGDLSVRVGGAAQIEVMGDANLRVHGNFNTQVNGDYNVYAGGAINMTSGAATNLKAASINLKGGSVIAGDAGQIHWNSGKSGTSTAAPLAAYSPSITIPAPVSRQDSNAYQLEEVDGVADLIGGGPLTPDEARAKSDAQTTADEEGPPPEAVAAVTGACGFTSLAYTTKLSANFTIKDLCKDGPFAFNGQNGLTGEELACNLKQLCLNIIEPLRAKYSNVGFKVNSCFRPRKNGKSQHEFGQAIDIGFSLIRGKPGDKAEYHRIAKEIRAMGLPFDQMLLEYTSSGSVWIHMSFSTKQKRGMVLTLNNHRTYGQGLLSIA